MKSKKSLTLEYKLRDAEVAMHRAVHTGADPRLVDKLREKYLTLYTQQVKQDKLYAGWDVSSQ